MSIDDEKVRETFSNALAIFTEFSGGSPEGVAG